MEPIVTHDLSPILHPRTLKGPRRHFLFQGLDVFGKYFIGQEGTEISLLTSISGRLEETKQ